MQVVHAHHTWNRADRGPDTFGIQASRSASHQHVRRLTKQPPSSPEHQSGRAQRRDRVCVHPPPHPDPDPGDQCGEGSRRVSGKVGRRRPHVQAVASRAMHDERRASVDEKSNGRDRDKTAAVDRDEVLQPARASDQDPGAGSSGSSALS